MDDDDIPESLPSDDTNLTFETDYTGRPPSIAVVETISAIEGVPPTDVSFTLHEQVDPEALDTLLDDGDDPDETGDVIAEFEIGDYSVQVTANGKLTVSAPEDTE